jgi:hypothetical protein
VPITPVNGIAWATHITDPHSTSAAAAVRAVISSFCILNLLPWLVEASVMEKRGFRMFRLKSEQKSRPTALKEIAGHGKGRDQSSDLPSTSLTGDR